MKKDNKSRSWKLLQIKTVQTSFQKTNDLLLFISYKLNRAERWLGFFKILSYYIILNLSLKYKNIIY